MAAGGVARGSVWVVHAVGGDGACVCVRVCVCACESVCAWQVFGAALCVAVWRLPVRVCEEVWDSM